MKKVTNKDKDVTRIERQEHGIHAVRAIAVALFLFVFSIPVRAGGSNDITGLWYTQEHDALIEIFKCGEKYCGRIVWSKEPNYPADDNKGRAGQPRVDDNNPDPNLRDRPILGLQIMNGFVYSKGSSKWKHGTVYDPKNGQTYSGTISLVSPDKLSLRGYVIFSLLGRSSIWTRSR